MALVNSYTEDRSRPILGIVCANGYQVTGLYNSGHEDDNAGLILLF